MENAAAGDNVETAGGGTAGNGVEATGDGASGGSAVNGVEAVGGGSGGADGWMNSLESPTETDN